MIDFRGNIEHWIRQSEPDFYLFFLKAWIPFNAWYVAELPNLKKKDSAIIKELQENPNSKPKKTIQRLIIGKDHESQIFQSHLAELHHYLIKNTLQHNLKNLSFEEISLSNNPKTLSKGLDKRGNLYKCEKKTSFYQAYIEAKGGKVLLDFKQPDYDIEALKKNDNFIKLADRRIQNKVLQDYESIDPLKTVSIISKSKIKSHYIELKSKNTCKVITDVETIGKACIAVLYSLRCMLFHGEIEPNNFNKPVYEHAYHILRYIVKDLH